MCGGDTGEGSESGCTDPDDVWGVASRNHVLVVGRYECQLADTTEQNTGVLTVRL